MAHLLTGCVTWGKLLHLSESQFLYLFMKAIITLSRARTRARPLGCQLTAQEFWEDLMCGKMLGTGVANAQKWELLSRPHLSEVITAGSGSSHPSASQGIRQSKLRRRRFRKSSQPPAWRAHGFQPEMLDCAHFRLLTASWLPPHTLPASDTPLVLFIWFPSPSES